MLHCVIMNKNMEHNCLTKLSVLSYLLVDELRSTGVLNPVLSMTNAL